MPYRTPQVMPSSLSFISFKNYKVKFLGVSDLKDKRNTCIIIIIKMVIMIN